MKKQNFYKQYYKPKKSRWVLWTVLAAVVVAVAIAVTVITLVHHHKGKQLNRIWIDQTPKTVYVEGEPADYEGLKILAFLNNGDSFEVPLSDCQITGFDSSAPAENQEITVSYGDLSARYLITIKALPVEPKYPVSIEIITMPKTEYTVGEGLDAFGGVLLCKYHDGTTAEIPMVNKMVWDYSYELPAGTYTLTVKYVENDVLVTTTYDITVSE